MDLGHRNAASLTMGACRIQYNTMIFDSATRLLRHGIIAVESSGFFVDEGRTDELEWGRLKRCSRKWIFRTVQEGGSDSCIDFICVFLHADDLCFPFAQTQNFLLSS